MLVDSAVVDKPQREVVGDCLVNQGDKVLVPGGHVSINTDVTGLLTTTVCTERGNMLAAPVCNTTSTLA